MTVCHQSPLPGTSQVILQDIIPAHGLSLQKPSILWPPPSDEITTRVHASLRSRIRQTLGIDEQSDDPVSSIVSEHQLSEPPTPGLPFSVGATTTRLPNRDNQTITLVTDTGEVLSIDQQVHLYTENSLLLHPLVSGALSYLGGLPPLLVIASDKEVLRDEIIYASVFCIHFIRANCHSVHTKLHTLIDFQSKKNPESCIQHWKGLKVALKVPQSICKSMTVQFLALPLPER